MKIVIASGKGGTGKTFVVTNLYAVAETSEPSLCIVDCDAEEPNLSEYLNGTLLQCETLNQKLPLINAEECTFCGACKEACTYNAIIMIPETGIIEVMEDLCHDCGVCSYVCPSAAIHEIDKPIGKICSMDLGNHHRMIETRTYVGTSSPVPVIKKGIQAAKDYALCLMDAPPGISCPFIASVESADYVVLVTEPTPFGWNDLKLSIETLQNMHINFGVIINRAGLGNNDIKEWLNEQQYTCLGEIPFRRDLAECYSSGRIPSREMPEISSLFTGLMHSIYSDIKRKQS